MWPFFGARWTGVHPLSFKGFWLRNSIQNDNCSQTNYVDLLHEVLSMLLIFKDIACFLSQIMTKLHYLNYFSKVSLKRIEQTKHAEPKSSQLLCYNLVSTEMEISFISPGRNIWIFVTQKAKYNCISLFGTSPPPMAWCSVRANACQVDPIVECWVGVIDSF